MGLLVNLLARLGERFEVILVLFVATLAIGGAALVFV
jgi:hypothetical protein